MVPSLEKVPYSCTAVTTIDLILPENSFNSVNLNDILLKSWEMDRDINSADEKVFNLYFIMKKWSPSA